MTPALFARYPTPADAGPRDARRSSSRRFSATGFFRDEVAQPALGMARRSSSATAARCRPTMDALVKLPGVGRKTANVVLGHALGVPGLPVDRHVAARREPHRPRALGGSRRSSKRSSARSCRPIAGRARRMCSSCTAAGSAVRGRSAIAARCASGCAYYRSARPKGARARRRQTANGQKDAVTRRGSFKQAGRRSARDDSGPNSATRCRTSRS